MKIELTNEELTIIVVTLQRAAREWMDQGQEQAANQREDVAYRLLRMQEEEAQ